MAETNRLAMKFKDAGDDVMIMSLANANPDVTDAQTKALMDGIITNKLMFERVPTTKVSAELITTTTTPLDIEDA